MGLSGYVCTSWFDCPYQPLPILKTNYILVQKFVSSLKRNTHVSHSYMHPAQVCPYVQEYIDESPIGKKGILYQMTICLRMLWQSPLLETCFRHGGNDERKLYFVTSTATRLSIIGNGYFSSACSNFS